MSTMPVHSASRQAHQGAPQDIVAARTRPTTRSTLRGAILLAVVVFGAYAPALAAGFVYDDVMDVGKNLSIRHLWPIWDLFVFRRSDQWGTYGRSAVNLTFAADYAWAGLDPLVFHLTNVGIHCAAVLTLFGLLRRTLLLPSMQGRFDAKATPLAFLVALLWAVHPLNTESVAYVTQRYESQMGLFYLLALYALARCGSSDRSGLWSSAVVAATFVALGSKEVAVSLPIVILLYDRAFLAGSFREALRQRRAMYGGLLAAWAVFFFVQRCAGTRETWAGYGLNVSTSEYALSQPGIILYYLRLAVWPHPLVLDYRWPVAHTWSEILPSALVVGGLLAATVLALVKRPRWGLLGAAFFLILAPTSSVLPLSDLAVEHRMYLPLIVVLIAAVLAGDAALGRLRSRTARGALDVPSVAAVASTGAVALVLATLTWQRCHDYHSQLTLWTDTVAKAPNNPRAHNVVGLALLAEGQFPAAAQEFMTVIRMLPELPEGENNLGTALMGEGQAAAAIEHFERALQLDPKYPDAHFNLAGALAAAGRRNEAIARYRQGLELDPANPDAHADLAELLLAEGQANAAINEWRRALRLRPDDLARLRRFAWVLATSPESSVRNGRLALKVAGEAVQLSAGQDADSLRALAAAHAEAGDYASALRLVDDALRLAEQSGDTQLVERLRSDRTQYAAGAPVRDATQASPGP